MCYRRDPVTFTRDWALTVPISVPLEGQVIHATQALQLHAVKLYENPLSRGLKKRERDRSVREQLACYRSLLEDRGFIQTTVDFKDAAHSFLEGFSTQDGKLFFEFPEKLSKTPMCRSAKTLTNRELAGVGDFATIRYINGWLRYLSKYPLERPDLEGPAETAWIERQENPFEITASTQQLEDVRRLVNWLIEVTPTFMGNHGPGSTSNGAKTVPDKNCDYRPTIQSRELTRFDVETRLEYVSSDPIFLIRKAVWMVVPKDVGSLRPITKEPVETQYAQQGLKHDIYKAVDDLSSRMPVSRFIRFTDQRPSQECALRGSLLTNDPFKPSTIDLKNASDRVSLDLVIALFSGNLLHYLMVGRSWDVKIGRKSVQLAMYGGMGSALTFPVQSIVFCALAIYASLIELHKREFGVEGCVDDYFELFLDSQGFKPAYRKIERSLRIYGDDIAVPDYAAERLMLLLKTFGLEVNTRKSFIGSSPVRESCGVYAIAGIDITPKLLRTPDSGQVIDGAKYEALRQYANDAYLKGERNLYRALIKLLTDSEIFISSKQYLRKSQRGSRFGYAKQALGKPTLLFQAHMGQERPDEVVVGFLSQRSTVPTHEIEIHERLGACTTYFVESVSERDRDSEFYHLTINYRQMSDPKLSSIEDHGSIPAGTRLKLRNAVLRFQPERTNDYMEWGWAPI